jgi:hypothetical protein
MTDLALVGMGLMTAGGTVAAVFATTLWLDVREELAELSDRYDRLLVRHSTTLELTTDDIVQPHVMCGACGKSAPLMADGFTIAEHNCEQYELNSDTYLRS